jgi:hypothetical protein
MELEAVGRVSMRNMGFEIRGKIDDVDRSEWTFLGTDTASNTQAFGDESNLRLRSDFDAKASASNNWARLLAFLSAFLYSIDQDMMPTL